MKLNKIIFAILVIAILSVLCVQMVLGSSGEKLAVPSQSSYVLDGNAVAVNASYNIEGSNYAQLRAVAQLLNGTKSQFNIYYDAASNKTVIETGKPYSGEGPKITTPATGEEKDLYMLGENIQLSCGTVTVTNAYISGNSFFIGEAAYRTSATSSYYIIELEVSLNAAYRAGDLLGIGHYDNNGRAGTVGGSSNFAIYSDIPANTLTKTTTGYIIPNTAQMEWFELKDPATGEIHKVFVNY